MKKRTILYAEDGKILTNGETYGRIIFLADIEDESTYYEIAEEEYEATLKESDIVDEIN